jgi:hypothetical protein
MTIVICMAPKIVGWDANDIWIMRCSGAPWREATPDECERWREENRLSDESIAEAMAYGLSAGMVAALEDWIMFVSQDDGSCLRISIERGVFKAERYREASHDS